MTLVHGFRWEQVQIAGLEIKNATLMSQQLILQQHVNGLEDRVKLLEGQIRADEKEIARLRAELEIAWSDENDPLMVENKALQAQNEELRAQIKALQQVGRKAVAQEKDTEVGGGTEYGS